MIKATADDVVLNRQGPGVYEVTEKATGDHLGAIQQGEAVDNDRWSSWDANGKLVTQSSRISPQECAALLLDWRNGV